jgi:hypothetical protein
MIKYEYFNIIFPARRVDMDTLALAQLQRRIKDAAQIKAKARAREKEGALGYRTLNPVL